MPKAGFLSYKSTRGVGGVVFFLLFLMCVLFVYSYFISCLG